MSSPGYLRFPHLHGDLLVFAADDDVWLAPASGGRGWRVSADRAPVRRPRFSRDGQALAWTSRRHGEPEILLSDLDGGHCRRLTWWADPSTQAVGWTPDGEVLALTAAGSPFERLAWAHVVPLAGGAARRLPYGPLADLAAERDGVALLNGTWGPDPAYWKRYRGGTGGRLWVAAGGGADSPRFTRVLADLPGQLACPMLIGGRLVFLSDHEGTGNVYSCLPDGTGLLRHTDHDGWYARNASTDGSRVVYQCGGDIWLLEELSAGSRPRRLEITLGSAVTGRAPRLVTAADELGDLSCDETGRASVIEVNGTIHWLTHRDGPARALSVDPAGRARLPCVLGRSGQAAWVTDAGGADALEIAPAGGGAGRRLAAGELGRVSELAAAPDGRTVAAAAEDGRLHLVEVASGAVRLLATSGDGPVSGLAFAPDSGWLAWSQPGPRPLSRIRLARLDDSQVIDVTDGRFADDEPAFSTEGKYLAFLSRRSFDPVYDAHFFDLSFPYGCRPYLVPLAAAILSPFAPLAAGRAVTGEPPPGQRASHPAAGQTGAEQDTPPTVTVDAAGLAGRAVPMPVPEAQYSSLAAVAGGFAWLRHPVTGVLGEGLADPDADRPRPSLERLDLAQRTCSEVAAELDWFVASGDGQQLVIRDRGELRVVPADRKDGQGSQPDRRVDLARARFHADPAAQRRHAFEEAGRVMRHGFWVPDLAGVDWDGVLAGYRPLLARLATADDFADLLSEVFGELGASHAYVRPAGSDQEPGERAGSLGADLVPGPDGSWQVSRVLPGESSDPRARSPLAGPGAVVQPGTVLVAVDGQPVDPAAGPGPLLAGAAGKPVELTLSPPGGDEQRVVVTPLASDRRLRYQDWVAARRARVRELSAGRAGYLHVPDMMGQGWAQFHRDLRAEMAQDTLIIDVRHNRGGHVSELVVEKLARRILGWDLGRWLQPATYPRDAPRGPVVALADEFAGSDGDMVTAAIRILGLGPVVGTRTWGGVIGIDGFYDLVDGTGMTVPRYAIWLEGYGWRVENHGVDPDVEVMPTPADWASGADPQLETAVRLALDALAARPSAGPPDTDTRPSRRAPGLPPRPAP